jgi:hypothetical protein
VQTHAFAAGFKVYLKKKNSALYWLICHCAGAPPPKASDLKPDAAPRTVVNQCIKCNCSWRAVIKPCPSSTTSARQPLAVVTDSLEQTDTATPVPWTFVSVPTSFSEGHNHALVVKQLSRPAGIGRIIAKSELTADILADVRNWCVTPSMCGKLLRQTVLAHHFGGDLKAVFDQQAINQLNNVAAAVRMKLAFTAGDSKEFVAELNNVVATGGYAAHDLSEDCTFKRAFWATREQVERAMEFGLDVIQQVIHTC